MPLKLLYPHRDKKQPRSMLSPPPPKGVHRCTKLVPVASPLNTAVHDAFVHTLYSVRHEMAPQADEDEVALVEERMAQVRTHEHYHESTGHTRRRIINPLLPRQLYFQGGDWIFFAGFLGTSDRDCRGTQ